MCLDFIGTQGLILPMLKGTLSSGVRLGGIVLCVSFKSIESELSII